MTGRLRHNIWTFGQKGLGGGLDPDLARHDTLVARGPVISLGGALRPSQTDQRLERRAHVSPHGLQRQGRDRAMSDQSKPHLAPPAAPAGGPPKAVA